MNERCLLLHPGEMGASIGAALRAGGRDVTWVRRGRSEATARRAEAAALGEAPDLAAGLAEAEHVISVCPPSAALEQAREVVDSGFSGTYVDANAVSPETALSIRRVVGARYVDGGIVGPPAWKAGSTRLYLSGEGASEVAGWFEGGPLEARVVSGSPVAASALKMCYAAYTKGSSALLLAVRALAEHEGITEALLEEWNTSLPGLGQRSEGAAQGIAPKAWRFVGEMREIAATFEAAGLPGGFHGAAGEIYGRLGELKDRDGPTLEDVLERLLAPPGTAPD